MSYYAVSYAVSCAVSYAVSYSVIESVSYSDFRSVIWFTDVCHLVRI